MYQNPGNCREVYVCIYKVMQDLYYQQYHPNLGHPQAPGLWPATPKAFWKIIRDLPYTYALNPSLYKCMKSFKSVKFVKFVSLRPRDKPSCCITVSDAEKGSPQLPSILRLIQKVTRSLTVECSALVKALTWSHVLRTH